jgi:hypothetical protein
MEPVFEHIFPNRRNYGRPCAVYKFKGDCLVCNAQTDILASDTSQGEYRTFDCCLPCFTKLIKESPNAQGDPK